MKRLVRVFDKTETCKILMEAETYIVDTPGTFYELIITPKKTTRNKDQNNLYWGLVDTITHWMNDKHDFGWTNQETHQFLKYEFFSDRETILDAVQAIQGGEITTTQFLTIVDSIISNTTTTEKDV